MQAAIDHLTAADPALGEVIRRVGPYTLTPAEEGTHFDALLRSIVYQQLSGKAAATIHGRVIALMGGCPDPEALLALADEALRGAGLSRQKVAATRALAERFVQDPLPADVSHLSDEQLIKALSSIRGIGRWSAQMFMMFRLGRLDVLPDADLGIQKGVMRLDNLDAMPSPKQVVARGQVWRPYATIASWYLWRSLD
ncbi:MAG: HhH-GPD family protein [Cyanobacteria bacterium RYN_339]|nr:HhH-GPD family protein [Cyanobacteria bacterium RYN_339]